MLVTVTALKPVVDGRDVCPGELLEMDAVRASIALRRGEISASRQAYQSRHMEVAPVVEAPKRRRRRRRKPAEASA